jgi:hypothetical protein
LKSRKDIAENVERRGQAETDPIKKARIVQFLREYWGVKNGGDRKSVSQNAKLKTTVSVSIPQKWWKWRYKTERTFCPFD